MQHATKCCNPSIFHAAMWRMCLSLRQVSHPKLSVQQGQAAAADRFARIPVHSGRMSYLRLQKQICYTARGTQQCSDNFSPGSLSPPKANGPGAISSDHPKHCQADGDLYKLKYQTAARRPTHLVFVDKHGRTELGPPVAHLPCAHSPTACLSLCWHKGCRNVGRSPGGRLILYRKSTTTFSMEATPASSKQDRSHYIARCININHKC